MNVRRAAVWALLLLLLPVWAVAAQGDEQRTVPTKITSDRMEYAPDKNAVVFAGKVQVDRQDFRLFADRISILFAPGEGQDKGKGASMSDTGRIEKILAEGNVLIRQEGRTATARTATYLVREGMLKLEGDPVLQEGQNRVKGTVIRLFLKDNRSEIVGGDKSRVEATFFTPADMSLGQ